MTEPHKVVVVLSGGQDSSYCLAKELDEGIADEILAVTFDYNQRHKAELEASKKIVRLMRQQYPGIPIEHEIITVGPILKGTSPLVNAGEELEQYADHHSLPGGLEKTFVPMRNQFFLTVAANRAYVIGARALVTGVCQEDFGGYPDCRQVFIGSLQNTCNLGTFTGKDGAVGNLTIHTPLMNMTKAEMIQSAVSEIWSAYWAWAISHTAYDGQFPPLGHDHATLLRAKGFEEANYPDPLVLRAHSLGLMDLPDTKNYSDEKLNERLIMHGQEMLGSLWGIS